MWDNHCPENVAEEARHGLRRHVRIFHTSDRSIEASQWWKSIIALISCIPVLGHCVFSHVTMVEKFTWFHPGLSIACL